MPIKCQARNNRTMAHKLCFGAKTGGTLRVTWGWYANVQLQCHQLPLKVPTPFGLMNKNVQKMPYHRQRALESRWPETGAGYVLLYNKCNLPIGMLFTARAVQGKIPNKWHFQTCRNLTHCLCREHTEGKTRPVKVRCCKHFFHVFVTNSS